MNKIEEITKVLNEYNDYKKKALLRQLIISDLRYLSVFCLRDSLSGEAFSGGALCSRGYN